MKKKFLILALCMSAALAVAACGNNGAESTEESTQESAKETVTYDGNRSAQMELDLEKQITKLSDYNGIEVSITGNYEVTDDAVESSVMQLLSYYGVDKVEVTDRDTVQDGDYVKIDYVGYKDDVAFEGGTATDVMMDVSNNLDVTSNSPYIDGFCDDMVGAKVGDELNTHVTFPEAYQSEELAGQPAVFKITIKGIYKQITLDALTDEAVAETFSSQNINTKDELIENMRSAMVSQMESYKSQAIANAAQNYILENSEVEISQEYLDARMAELEYSMMLDNCSEGQTLAEFFEENGTTLEEQREEWKTSLNQQIKMEMLFGRIAELEGIEVDEEEFTQFVEYLVSSGNGTFSSAEDVYDYYGIGNVEDGEKALRQLFRVNRALSFVSENANVTVETEESEE